MKNRLLIHGFIIVLSLGIFIPYMCREQKEQPQEPTVTEVQTTEATTKVESKPIEETTTALVEETITDEMWNDIQLLACVIYQEAGGDNICDECRYRVGDVVLNRVNDPRFPDTIEEVLTQPRQYGRFYITGVVWPERASYEEERNAVIRAYEVATDILVNGNHSDLYGKGYIWQAEFPQGTSDVICDGLYFGH